MHNQLYTFPTHMPQLQHGASQGLGYHHAVEKEEHSPV